MIQMPDISVKSKSYLIIWNFFSTQALNVVSLYRWTCVKKPVMEDIKSDHLRKVTALLSYI